MEMADLLQLRVCGDPGVNGWIQLATFTLLTLSSVMFVKYRNRAASSPPSQEAALVPSDPLVMVGRLHPRCFINQPVVGATPTTSIFTSLITEIMLSVVS